MAIIRTSHIVGGITGTLGSVDYVQGTTGLYVRKRPRSTIRRSPVISAARSQFSTLTNHWRKLTDSQRQAWRSAAALSNFRNRLGIPRKLSGFQLFMQINLTRPVISTIIETAPNRLTKTPAPTNLVILRLLNNLIQAEYTITAPTIDQTVTIFAARPVTLAPRRHYSNWKFLDRATTGEGDWSIGITNQFHAALGIPEDNEIVGILVYAQDPGRLLSYKVTSSGVLI